jgi:hypothetical protein
LTFRIEPLTRGAVEIQNAEIGFAADQNERGRDVGSFGKNNATLFSGEY